MAKLLLIDEVVEQGPMLGVAKGTCPPKIWSLIRDAKYNAARFVFDKEASKIAGEFACGCGDLVLANRQFAIPPYPITYVEINNKSFFTSAKATPEERRRADDRVGYLVRGNYLYTFFGINGLRSGISWWRYKVLSPGQFAGLGDVRINLGPELAAAIQRDKLAYGIGNDPLIDEGYYYRMAVMFGSAVEIAEKSTRNLFLIKQASSECAMEWLDPHCLGAQRGFPAEALAGFMGDVRNYWALMLWLNQPRRTALIAAPGGRQIKSGKMVTFLKHNVVKIKLGKYANVRRAYLANQHTPRRGGDVRGHFRHKGGYSSCYGGEGHDWPVSPDERGHWICRRCGKERWHVREHFRSGVLGTVTKDYSVEE